MLYVVIFRVAGREIFVIRVCIKRQSGGLRLGFVTCQCLYIEVFVPLPKYQCGGPVLLFGRGILQNMLTCIHHIWNLRSDVTCNEFYGKLLSAGMDS